MPTSSAKMRGLAPFERGKVGNGRGLPLGGGGLLSDLGLVVLIFGILVKLIVATIVNIALSNQ
jgi:hypothetical protein